MVILLKKTLFTLTSIIRQYVNKKFDNLFLDDRLIDMSVSYSLMVVLIESF